MYYTLHNSAICYSTGFGVFKWNCGSKIIFCPPHAIILPIKHEPSRQRKKYQVWVRCLTRITYIIFMGETFSLTFWFRRCRSVLGLAKGEKKSLKEKKLEEFTKSMYVQLCSCFLLTYAKNASNAYESRVCTAEIMDIKAHTFKGISAWTAEERDQFALCAYIYSWWPPCTQQTKWIPMSSTFRCVFNNMSNTLDF